MDALFLCARSWFETRREKVDVYSRVNENKIPLTHTHAHTLVLAHPTRHGVHKIVLSTQIYSDDLFSQVIYLGSPQSFTIVQFAGLTTIMNLMHSTTTIVTVIINAGHASCE